MSVRKGPFELDDEQHTQDPVSSATRGPVILNSIEPPCTDPYARWCDGESSREPTYVD